MLRFIENNPEPDTAARIDEYFDFKSFDLVADPMTVTQDVPGYDASGNETIIEKTTDYPQADWTGEEIT